MVVILATGIAYYFHVLGTYNFFRIKERIDINVRWLLLSNVVDFLVFIKPENVK